MPKLYVSWHFLYRRSKTQLGGLPCRYTKSNTIRHCRRFLGLVKFELIEAWITCTPATPVDRTSNVWLIDFIIPYKLCCIMLTGRHLSTYYVLKALQR